MSTVTSQTLPTPLSSETHCLIGIEASFYTLLSLATVYNKDTVVLPTDKIVTVPMLGTFLRVIRREVFR
jgi:hypothetical protein